MPGPGGNQPKKNPKPKKGAGEYKRFSEGYGPMIEVIPDVLYKRKTVSDAIRGYGSNNSKTPYGS